MASILPNITQMPQVHGMSVQDLPGFYNSSCTIFSHVMCFSELNLECVNDRCLCIPDYVPNGEGGCKVKVDPMSLLLWVIRLFICTCVFVICFYFFHVIISRRWCGARGGRQQGEREGEAEEGRRASTSTCYDEPPPPYLEVTDEAPPPTYLEAVMGYRGGEGATKGDTRGPTEPDTPPEAANPRGERTRGVGGPACPPLIFPTNSPTPAPQLTLHI